MDSPAWHREMAAHAQAAGGLTVSPTGFYFLRHGETEHNRRRIIQPKHGVPLNETGRRQARAAAEKLARCSFSAIYASEMERAWETATIVAEICARPLYPAPGLQERDWGAWAGRSNVDLEWAGHPEGGESLEQFTRRTVAALNEVLGNGEITIVAHGGTYAVLLAALGLPLRPPPETGPRVIGNATPMRVEPVARNASVWRVRPL